ncbi:MAG: hypothetical protein E7163_02500 [Firmicutes bacterium]|nr:hypothetical protein [Bacillota bacterium]
MSNKRMILLLVISILIVVVCTVGITYAYLSVSTVQTDPNIIETSCYETDFKEETGSRINLISYPMSSEKAFEQEPYKFTITNLCATNTNYQILLNIKNNTANNLIDYINYSLDGTNINKLSTLTPVSLPLGAVSSDVSVSYVLESGTLNGINAKQDHNLYLWIDESAGNDIMGLNFEAEVMIYNVATQ